MIGFAQKYKANQMSKTLIIAEAGVNHNGSLAMALNLVDVAINAGADYVKFQTFTAETLTSSLADSAPYQKIGSNKKSQFELLKSLELSDEMHREIRSYCTHKGIKFLSTPFSEADSDYLETMVDLFKVPSGELTNLPFLQYLAYKRKQLIVSTGMGTVEEVNEAKRAIFEVWNKVGFPLASRKLNSPLTFLHCTTAYPTPFSDVNLRAMKILKEATGCPIGYSDHTAGIEVSLAAVALGAPVIEKHFTLNRELPGPDHKSSLEPGELKALVSGIRNIELAMGSEQKFPSETESENAKVVRKSLHYKRSLPAGTCISKELLLIKRPGTGLPPNQLNAILGKVLKRAVLDDALVNQLDFE